jgi:hypothetical protein
MKTALHILRLAFLFFASARIAFAIETNSSVGWSVAYLDQVLAAVQPGQTTAQVGDMQILVTNLQYWRDELVGKANPQLAFDGTAPTWPGGNVYYVFDTNSGTAVPDIEKQAFIDCANEWAAFANLHFFQRTTQSNYVLVSQQASLDGGQSAVGMIGGQQSLLIGPSAWNHPTLCHELGHTLGLVHEHQRSDRDSYVMVLSNNIQGGELGNFVLLPNSKNKSAYDFLSIMHYNRNSFSINPSIDDTLEPLPAYSRYLNIMGQQDDPVLSASDRAGMAAIYGPGPAVTSVVTNTQDSGPGSLRTALYYAFDHPGTTITFNIPASDPGFSNNVFNILPTDFLPSLVNAGTLDGTTEPVHSNAFGPSIQLNGARCYPPSVYPDGLRLRGTNCSVKSIIVNGFPVYGIEIYGSNATGNVVSGCYLGIDPTGTLPVTNVFSPLAIDNGASGNTVGGTTAAARNIISGSPYQGLVIRDSGTTNNRVIGNYIGLNAAGTLPLSNTWTGVAIFNGAQSNVIGGASAAMRNIISGNGEQGVVVADPGTTGNIVEGNYIGLNPAGTAAISNAWPGVNFFNGATGNTVGMPGAPNVISGNGGQGVLIQDAGTDNNVVQNNFIGVDPTGATAISNSWAGVEIYNGPSGNYIGRSNIISGNGEQGIVIDTGSSYNVVQGNWIGLDATGSRAVSNRWAGVELYNAAQNNVIGGVGPGQLNVLSGNGAQGIFIDTASINNLVEGNYVGLDASGLRAVPNSYAGVECYNNASNNVIGGGLGARNYIAGNNNAGVAIDYGSSGNVLQGNSIGVNVAGAVVPNIYQGVSLFAGAISNVIGGTTLGAANLIAGNGYDGVDIFDSASQDNSVRGNSVVNNGGGLGLVNGGNFSAPAPVLASASVATNLTVAGSLTSAASTAFHLDFYASPAASPEMAVYLGDRDVTTSPAGTANFSFAFSGVVPIGQVISAVATDPNGNSSGQSGTVTVTGTDSVGDGIPDAWRQAHFGGNGMTSNSTNCASCDPDHDGMSNYQEFLAGTNPNSAASVLALGHTTLSNGLPVVDFQSTSGTVYRVDFSDNLALGQWQILADDILGTGAVIQIQDTSAPGYPDRFYRVVVMP